MIDRGPETQRFVLLETLKLAVPMHMAELRHCSPDALTAIASEAATVVGSHGDALQFGGQHCAEAFNALARGMAAAALVAWGGITWQGLHWCTIPGCSNPYADHPNPWPAPPAPSHRPVADVRLPDDLCL